MRGVDHEEAAALSFGGPTRPTISILTEGRGDAAFVADLEKFGQLDRTLVMTFSEFGRRVAENGSRGTDHGAAAPVLLVGAPVRAGLHGTPPDLSHLERGDVPFSTDFRAIYTTLESDWMGLRPSSPHPALDLLG